ncbi:Uncharacterised protein [Bacteroides xylanisolvens]|jgi:hypothetical protein|nr:Uncharacterised protein [Bacteroides xylanisolvens]
METYTTYIRFRLRVNASGELRREFQDWSSLLFFLNVLKQCSLLMWLQ